MKLRTFLCTLVWVGVLSANSLLAQDIAVTNVRIIAGDGSVIDSGTIVVRGGRIAEIGPGPISAPGLPTIDADGLTAMPGVIDAHRHINTGPNEREEMQAQLEAGYTTILSGGGPAEGNVILRDRIESGEINGPRIIPSGRISLGNNTPETARQAVRDLAEAGVLWTGEISLTPPPRPSLHEIEVLAPSGST